jgi:crotonobetainyl-CoA:carnitine CoA-transferase CaiB-like acyl-CoA transferase
MSDQDATAPMPKRMLMDGKRVEAARAERTCALGPRGLESSRGGYDMTAFWARGTSAASITPPNVDGLINPPPAYGDTISGTNLAGGIAAAPLKRERTGEPSIVDVSLFGSGLWTVGHALSVSLHLSAGSANTRTPTRCGRTRPRSSGTSSSATRSPTQTPTR